MRSTAYFDVIMETSGNAEYDYCCFGVDGAGKLSDDRYMVFTTRRVPPMVKGNKKEKDDLIILMGGPHELNSRRI